MFGCFLLGSKEKDLIKIGFQPLIDSLKKQLKNKEITKQTYHKTIEKWHSDNKLAIQKGESIQAYIKQSFNEREILPPMNLSNIQMEVVDVDYLQSLILFDYKENRSVNQQVVNELKSYLEGKYAVEKKTSDSVLPMNEWVALVSQTISNENAQKVYMALCHIPKV